MAIPVTNIAYVTQGPTKTGQILAGNNLSEAETALIGTTTIVLDGTLTTATINFIDGTQTLNAAPSAVFAQATGGTAAVGVVAVTTITATSFAVTLSGAGTAAQTLKIAFIVVK